MLPGNHCCCDQHVQMCVVVLLAAASQRDALPCHRLLNVDAPALINSHCFLFSPLRIKDEPEDDGYFASPKEDIKPLKRPRDEDE